MDWFLVISLLNSDELLVKRMHSKEECIQAQTQFNKTARKKIKQIEDVICEEGDIFESYDTGGNKQDEIL